MGVINYIGNTIFDDKMDMSSGLLTFIEKNLKDFLNMDKMTSSDKYIAYTVLSFVGKNLFKDIQDVCVFNMCVLHNDDMLIKNNINFIITYENESKVYFSVDAESVTNIKPVFVNDVMDEYYKNIDFVEEFKYIESIKNVGKNIVTGSIYNCNLTANEFFEVCNSVYENIQSPLHMSIYTDKILAKIKEEHITNNLYPKNSKFDRKEFVVSIKDTTFYIYYTCNYSL
jgi:hypothetical protein